MSITENALPYEISEKSFTSTEGICYIVNLMERLRTSSVSTSDTADTARVGDGGSYCVDENLDLIHYNLEPIEEEGRLIWYGVAGNKDQMKGGLWLDTNYVYSRTCGEMISKTAAVGVRLSPKRWIISAVSSKGNISTLLHCDFSSTDRIIVTITRGNYKHCNAEPSIAGNAPPILAKARAALRTKCKILQSNIVLKVKTESNSPH